MTKKKELKTGDLFAIKFDDVNYYFGKVLFDVKNQYFAKVTEEESFLSNYLSWFKESLLIETYQYISQKPDISHFEIAVKSEFVAAKKLKINNIKILHNTFVDPKSVSFPETLSNIHRRGILFTVGELGLQTNFTTSFADEVKVFPSLGNIHQVGVATLDAAGRRDLINPNDIMDNYFRWSDIRSIPEVREKIYKAIGESPDQTYYELALKHGFDLARFYR